MDKEFLKGEERSGFFVDETMKKVWLCDIRLLEELERICEKYDIKWFADGGTLLGAVRHGGFIPWDDDIDIQMLREDYDRFLEACKNELPDYYFLQYSGSEKGFQPWHAKLRDERTTGSTKFETNCYPQWHRGIFIDIFPLDNIPDGKAERFFHMTYLKAVRMLLQAYEVRLSPYAKKVSKILAFFVLGALNLFTSHDRLCEVYLKKLRSVKGETKMVGVTAFAPGVKKYEWNREIFEETCILPFEWRTITCPKNTHERLRIQYGDDYMVFKKGTAQHTTIYFDPDKSYKEEM